jgi:hypothetical protein
MQVSSQYVAVLVALSLYKPAASAMRIMVETALYYTYFRTHHAELATLARDPAFYVEKRDLVEYHKKHTPDFGSLQSRLGVLVRLERWYSTVSAIVHGQIPGAWVEHKIVAEIKNIAATQEVSLYSRKSALGRFFCNGKETFVIRVAWGPQRGAWYGLCLGRETQKVGPASLVEVLVGGDGFRGL